VLPTLLQEARPEQHPFFSGTSAIRKVPFGPDQALARLLHYSKAKGGRHENQDEREGWSHHPLALMSYSAEQVKKPMNEERRTP
jgi:hypothetical protein